MVEVNKAKAIVRTCTVEDVEFLTECQLKLAFETEDKTMDKELVTNGVRNVILNDKLGKFYLAYMSDDPDQTPVGSTMTTIELSPALGGIISWIQSVYVEKELRGKGVFRTLYNTIVEEARANKQVKCVRLYVETENETAIAVYSKLGMAQMDKYDYVERDLIL